MDCLGKSWRSLKPLVSVPTLFLGTLAQATPMEISIGKFGTVSHLPSWPEKEELCHHGGYVRLPSDQGAPNNSLCLDLVL